jgi:protease II
LTIPEINDRCLACSCEKYSNLAVPAAVLKKNAKTQMVSCQNHPVTLQSALTRNITQSFQGDLMALRERVQELLDFLQTNPPAEQVYERFYDEKVVVQENLQPPRVGRSLSIERQKQMNANIKEVHFFKIGTVLVDGDHSVIELQLEATTVDGYRIRIEELGLQTWQDGRIIHERFFYDPSQIQGVTKEINEIH